MSTSSLAGARIAIVGSGQIGLTAAYFLQQRGADITILERDSLGSGAARGNGGLMSSTSATVLNEPGIVSHGLRHLFSSSSAFFVDPRALPSMSRWLMQFARRTSQRDFDIAVKKLDLLTVDTFALFDKLGAEGIGTQSGAGMLRCFASESAARADREATLRLGVGRPVAQTPGGIMDRTDLVALEPSIGDDVNAGYAVAGERFLNPSTYVDELFAVLSDRGLDFRRGEEVVEVVEDAGRGVVRTRGGVESFDRVLVAAGARSTSLLEGFGARMLIRPGKGYSFSFELDDELSRVLFFGDAHAAAIPLGGGRVRMAGTMEFDGSYDRLNQRRISALKSVAERNVRGIRWDTVGEEWVGARPMTVDGLPFIGPVSPAGSVHVATGHNMIGFALGPSTGQLVADLMSGVRRPAEEAAFDPFRFSRRAGKRTLP